MSKVHFNFIMDYLYLFHNIFTKINSQHELNSYLEGCPKYGSYVNISFLHITYQESLNNISKFFNSQNDSISEINISMCFFEYPLLTTSSESINQNITLKDTLLSGLSFKNGHFKGSLFFKDTIFEEEINIVNCKFKKVEFENVRFSFKVEKDFSTKQLVCHHFAKNNFNCTKSIFEFLNFYRLSNFKFFNLNDLTIEHLLLDKCHLNNSSFTDLFIKQSFAINESIISNFNLKRIYIDKNSIDISRTVIKHIDRETARFIKHEAYKINNTIGALEYKICEMNEYRKEVRKWKTGGTYLLLTLNKWSNNYGKSWQRGLLFTTVCWIVFFNLFIGFRDGFGWYFIWSNPNYIKEAVSYLWLLDGLNEISKCEVVNWPMAIFFVLGKVMIAYGIYQTISAFRRFGK